MKIVVVNYNEICKRKSANEVAADIIKAYISADENTLENMGSELRQKLLERDEFEILFIDTDDRSIRKNLIYNIQSKNPDLLITYGFAGFEMTTLTDSLGYNLVDCRQFHFIENNDILINQYLKKEKSINMFFFYSGEYREGASDAHIND